MIGSVRSQAGDVGSDVAVRAPSLGLASRSMPVIRCRAILEMNGRRQRMRIQ